MGSAHNEILSTEGLLTTWPSSDAGGWGREMHKHAVNTVPGEAPACDLVLIKPSVPVSVLPVEASREGSWKFI